MTILYNGNPDGLLTYTSPSAKLCMGPSGTYRYGPHNLYVNSASPANQSITVVSGAAYTVVITGSVSVTASGAATGTWTAGTTNFTAATGTLTLGSTSGAGTVHVRRTNSDTTYLQTGASARYGLPYEWNTSGVLQGILVEEARTNLNPYSRPQAAWVTKTGFTFTENAAVGRIGTSATATLLTRTASVAYATPLSISKAVGALPYTATFIVKASVGDYFISTLQSSGANRSSVRFNLSTGIASAPVEAGFTGGSSTVTDIGGGYWKLTHTSTTDGTQANIYSYCSISSVTITAVDGNDTGYPGTVAACYLEYAGLEAGTFGTSPIETFGATVTRAADNISLAASAFPYSAAAGTLFAQFSASNSDMTSVSIYYAAVLNDGSSNNTIGLYRYQTNIGAAVVASGASQSDQYKAPGSPTSPHKDAVSFASNDIRQATDGVLSTPDTNATIPTATKLSLSRANNNHINGYLAKVMYLPRSMSNAELQTLTT